MRLGGHCLGHETAEELRAGWVASVHLKDVRCDFRHMFLKYDDVLIGGGGIDYDTHPRRMADLPTDTPCYGERLPDEAARATDFARLHELAAGAGVRFLTRKER